MSAKAKLMIFISCLCIAGVLLTARIGYATFKHAPAVDYTDKRQQQEKEVAQYLERYFDELQIKADELNIGANGRFNKADIINTLVLLKEQSQITNAYLGLKNGDTYGAIRKEKIANFNAKKLHREWYERGFSGENMIITAPYQGSNGFMVIALATPVIRNGLVVAVLCLNLPLTRTQSLLKL